MEKAVDSPFVRIFGKTPLIKVIDFFLTYPSFDYTKSFVANEVGISRVTIDKVWKELAESKLIVKTRTIGNAEYFQLNQENPRVKVLMKTAIDLSLSEVKEKVPA